MDRDIAGAVESAKKLEPLYPNSVIMTVEADVSDSESVLAAADAIFDRFNTIHLLCNNAGVSSVGQLWDTPLTDWHTVWSVNLMGAVHGLRAFVPRMLEVG